MAPSLTKDKSSILVKERQGEKRGQDGGGGKETVFFGEDGIPI